ncbi:MAG: hypothetical protein ACFCUN_08195 [Hyphomicrobiaceae bacterium]
MTNQPEFPKFSPKVRERAVRMVLDRRDDHPLQRAAIASIAGQIGITPQTLSNPVKQAERKVGEQRQPDRRPSRRPKRAVNQRM